LRIATRRSATSPRRGSPTIETLVPVRVSMAETLTYAPIDRALITMSLLGADEVAWIDAYHAEVFKRVSGGLTVAENRWLEAATKPL